MCVLLSYNDRSRSLEIVGAEKVEKQVETLTDKYYSHVNGIHKVTISIYWVSVLFQDG